MSTLWSFCQGLKFELTLQRYTLFFSYTIKCDKITFIEIYFVSIKQKSWFIEKKSLYLHRFITYTLK